MIDLKRPWSITESEFERLQELAKSDARVTNRILKKKIEQSTDDELKSLYKAVVNKADGSGLFAGSDIKREYAIRDGIAIIGIESTIVRYEDICAVLCGFVSIESLRRQFDMAMSDPEVEGIVFDINSPGGEFDGTPEFAEHVLNSRGQKPIVAYVSRLAASAAYWIATACDKIVCHSSAEVGCIGVRVDFDVLKEEFNAFETITLVSSITPNKNIDIMSDDGKKRIVSYLNELAMVFIENVAKHRRVSTDKVLEQYGKGDTILGRPALSIGMIDKLGNFEEAIKTASEPEGEEMPDENKPDEEEIQEEEEQEEEATAQEEKEKEDTSALKSLVTKSWIKSNRPDIYEEIIRDGQEIGAESESKRIDGIMNVNIKRYGEKGAKLRTEAIKDRSMTASEFALKLVNMEGSDMDEMLANRKNESIGDISASNEELLQDSETDKELKKIRNIAKKTSEARGN